MGHSITAVEYSSPTGTVLATSHSDVEAALSNTLQARFKGAHSSPFLHAPLLLWLVCLVLVLPCLQSWRVHFNALLASMNILNFFIEALQFPSPEIHSSHISSLLQPEDFISHWRKAKECTSSSPSRLHFSHYKAATYSESLAFLHGHFTQLVFMTGLSLSHYQAGLQVILEKKAGNIHVNNL